MKLPRIEAYPGTANWTKARQGMVTGSNMHKVLAVRKDGKPSEERTRYLWELAAERATGYSVDHYVTPAMVHGLECEPLARAAYEEATGRITIPAGFVLHPEIQGWGATPDNWTVDGGELICVQYKCPTSPRHLACIKAGVVPDEYRAQMIAECEVSGTRACDFVSFDPRQQNERLRLFVRRYTPTDDEREKVRAAVVQFIAEMEEVFEALSTQEMIA